VCAKQVKNNQSPRFVIVNKCHRRRGRSSGFTALCCIEGRIDPCCVNIKGTRQRGEYRAAILGVARDNRRNNLREMGDSITKKVRKPVRWGLTNCAGFLSQWKISLQSVRSCDHIERNRLNPDSEVSIWSRRNAETIVCAVASGSVRLWRS
jgi:hypothetical protein